MKMKARQIINFERIISRFKKIFGAFLCLFAVQYFLSYTLRSVRELEIEENESLYGGSFFAVEAAPPKEKSKWKDSKINPTMYEDYLKSGVICDKSN